MACDITAGRAYPCKDALGGIKEVLLCAYDDIVFGAVSAGAIADITSDTTLYRFVSAKNAGSLAQNIQSSVENGTVFFEQVLTIQMPKLEAAVNDNLHNVLKNRLVIIARDNNDNFHVIGYGRGAEVTGGNFGTGAASGDLNGYNIVFTAEEKAPAYFAPDLSNATVVAALTGAVTISPAY
jgi:hypothetical protein